LIEATAFVGALGLVLLASGLPPLRSRRMTHRIEPYLSGLHGRPSALLHAHGAPAGGFGRWLDSRIRRVWRSGPTDLISRLAAEGDRRGPEAFRVEQFTWGMTAAVGSCALAVLLTAVGLRIDLRTVPAFVGICFVSGFLGRDWWLGRQIEARRAQLAEELPVAIDLITLSIMAGESIPAACLRVAGVMSGGIGDEFNDVVADIRAGKGATEALEAMAHRLPHTGMARLVDSLCTAIERGAPLADILRAQADDGREARRRALLELGGRREVLMLIPVVFLIMPVVVVFALYPGLVSLDLLVP
jgi:tight adherence protein C